MPVAVAVRWNGRERRAPGLVGALRRDLFELRRIIRELADGLPCSLLRHLGVEHKRVEIPRTFRRSTRSDGSQLRWKCKRWGVGCGQEGLF